MGSKLNRVKNYPNLYRDENSRSFAFRKYSKLKHKEFHRVIPDEDNPARAYKKGLDAFNDWLDKDTDASGVVYFAKFARKYLNSKLEDPEIREKTKKTFRNQLEPSPLSTEKNPRPRLIDGLGHLPIEKVTKEKFKEWRNLVLAEYPGFKFFNAKKALVELLSAAKDAGYLKSVPDFGEISDAPPAPAVYLERKDIVQILKRCHSVRIVGKGKKTGPMRRKDGMPGYERIRSRTKLLAFIMWKQGARPGEVLQYKFEMFNFKTGTLFIPGEITKTGRDREIPLNPKVLRIVKFLSKHSDSPFLFPSPTDPDKPMGEYATGWNGACARAGVEANIYFLRDTFVTDKFVQGLSDIFVAKYIDSSPEMLRRKYAVAIRDVMEKVAGAK
jgi:integrase